MAAKVSSVWRDNFRLEVGRHPLYWYLWVGPIELRWIYEPDTATSLDLMRQNGINRCLHCDIEITLENYSGWDGFAEGDFTQPICITCNEKRGNCHRCNIELTEENDGGILTVRSDPWLGWSICKLCRFTRHHWLKEVALE
jgi:hypothetical protein